VSVTQLQNIDRVGIKSLLELRPAMEMLRSTGTIASGCAMLLVAFGVLPLSVTSFACDDTLPAPLISMSSGCESDVALTT